MDLHFHDIRGTTVTMLAEAGCTLPEIVSITGHTLRRAQDILDKYLDRLVHHATILEMNVESYRRRAALDRKRGRGRPPTRATIKENAD